MLISLVNLTRTESDEKVARIARSINRQIAEDFAPHWHLTARLRLEGRGERTSARAPQDLRGDAVIYLWEGAGDARDAVHYHARHSFGLPCAFVFTKTAEDLREDWSVTLSREALELLGDSRVNLLAAGPHPRNCDRCVLHWYRMCAAVQAEWYELDGVRVSNFVLPLYFAMETPRGARADYLNIKHDGQTLSPFGVNPGGSIGFFDPDTGQHETFMLDGDQAALERARVTRELEPRLARASLYRSMAQRLRTRSAQAWVSDDGAR
jgi:hypothetical protein